MHCHKHSKPKYNLISETKKKSSFAFGEIEVTQLVLLHYNWCDGLFVSIDPLTRRKSQWKHTKKLPQQQQPNNDWCEWENRQVLCNIDVCLYTWNTWKKKLPNLLFVYHFLCFCFHTCNLLTLEISSLHFHCTGCNLCI